jgi:hypothetical protein
MRLSPGVADQIGLQQFRGNTGRLPGEMLASARRRARVALAVLWLAFSLGLLVLPEEAVLALAVLLAGLTTVLESIHGALAFDQLVRRIVAGSPAR